VSFWTSFFKPKEKSPQPTVDVFLTVASVWIGQADTTTDLMAALEKALSSLGLSLVEAMRLARSTDVGELLLLFEYSAVARFFCLRLQPGHAGRLAAEIVDAVSKLNRLKPRSLELFEALIAETSSPEPGHEEKRCASELISTCVEISGIRKTQAEIKAVETTFAVELFELHERLRSVLDERFDRFIYVPRR
jgi:hypothetical protein